MAETITFTDSYITFLQDCFTAFSIEAHGRSVELKNKYLHPLNGLMIGGTAFVVGAEFTTAVQGAAGALATRLETLSGQTQALADSLALLQQKFTSAEDRNSASAAALSITAATTS